jgi:rRNA maturation RNase YbeY
MINFFFQDVKKERLLRNRIRLLLEKISKDYDYNIGLINIVFCDDKYILEINRRYLSHDEYTDIITFNYNEKRIINGELYISIERVRENAEIYAEKFVNEIIRVIIHGILHLVGKNDKTDEELKEMRRLENFYLDVYKKIN